jgi:DNA-directed RNA polymerase subunit RPC12/RpoP
MKKMVECEHCKGKKMCTVSGGRSCHDCLAKAGRQRKDWATVRCAQCGGRGLVLMDVKEEKKTGGEEKAEEEKADA